MMWQAVSGRPYPAPAAAPAAVGAHSDPDAQLCAASVSRPRRRKSRTSAAPSAVAANAAQGTPVHYDQTVREEDAASECGYTGML